MVGGKKRKGTVVSVCQKGSRSWGELVRTARAVLEDAGVSDVSGVVIWESPIRCIVILPILDADGGARPFDIPARDGRADVRSYFLPVLIGRRIRDWEAETGRTLISAVYPIGPAGIVLLRSPVRIDEHRARAYALRLTQKWGPAVVFLLSGLPELPDPGPAIRAP